MVSALKDIIVLAEKAPKMLYCLLCSNVFREPYICTCGVSAGAPGAPGVPGAPGALCEVDHCLSCLPTAYVLPVLCNVS